MFYQREAFLGPVPPSTAIVKDRYEFTVFNGKAGRKELDSPVRVPAGIDA